MQNHQIIIYAANYVLFFKDNSPLAIYLAKSKSITANNSAFYEDNGSELCPFHLFINALENIFAEINILSPFFTTIAVEFPFQMAGCLLYLLRKNHSASQIYNTGLLHYYFHIFIVQGDFLENAYAVLKNEAPKYLNSSQLFQLETLLQTVTNEGNGHTNLMGKFFPDYKKPNIPKPLKLDIVYYNDMITYFFSRLVEAEDEVDAFHYIASQPQPLDIFAVITHFLKTPSFYASFFLRKTIRLLPAANLVNFCRKFNSSTIIPELFSYMTQEQIDHLIHNNSVDGWTVISSYQGLSPYILTWNLLLERFPVNRENFESAALCVNLIEFTEPKKKLIYQLCNFLLENSSFYPYNDNVISILQANLTATDWCISKVYEFCNELITLSCRNPLDDNLLTLIANKFANNKERVNLLKKISQDLIPCPRDQLELYAYIVIARNSHLQEDINSVIAFLLQDCNENEFIEQKFAILCSCFCFCREVPFLTQAISILTMEYKERHWQHAVIAGIPLIDLLFYCNNKWILENYYYHSLPENFAKRIKELPHNLFCPQGYDFFREEHSLLVLNKEDEELFSSLLDFYPSAMHSQLLHSVLFEAVHDSNLFKRLLQRAPTINRVEWLSQRILRRDINEYWSLFDYACLKNPTLLDCLLTILTTKEQLQIVKNSALYENPYPLPSVNFQLFMPFDKETEGIIDKHFSCPITSIIHTCICLYGEKYGTQRWYHFFQSGSLPTLCFLGKLYQQETVEATLNYIISFLQNKKEFYQFKQILLTRLLAINNVDCEDYDQGLEKFREQCSHGLNSSPPFSSFDPALEEYDDMLDANYSCAII